MRWNYLPLPKLQRCNRWSLGVDKSFHSTLYWTCDYLSMPGLKFIHINERGPSYPEWPALISSQYVVKLTNQIHNYISKIITMTSRERHDGVSNHRPLDCLTIDKYFHPTLHWACNDLSMSVCSESRANRAYLPNWAGLLPRWQRGVQDVHRPLGNAPLCL